MTLFRRLESDVTRARANLREVKHLGPVAVAMFSHEVSKAEEALNAFREEHDGIVRNTRAAVWPQEVTHG